VLHSSILSEFELETAGNADTFPVYNPATGELLAQMPAMSAAETVAALNGAQAALATTHTVAERSAWLLGIEQGLLARREELAAIITQEQGKPLPEARVEVEYAAGFFKFYAKAIENLEPHRIEESIRSARWTTFQRPAGVVALITPWNFPLAMLAKKLAPALAAGCATVTKPAELAPLSAIALRAVAIKAGVPGERVQILTGPPESIGDVFCSHPAVRLISFTGSTGVGQLLSQKAAPHLKRLALELGGNAPFIVFEDADLEAAAAAVVPNKFRCAGQTCVCANRFYVHQSVVEEFTRLVIQHVARLRSGNGMDAGVDLGPLINKDGWEKVVRHVNDALAKGASRVFGIEAEPSRHEWGHYFPPTVLTGTNSDMLLSREETFGPVVAIGAFETEEEAVALANSSQFGLAAYVFSGAEERIERLLPCLQFGHVGVNTGTGPTPEAAFGGMKQSGYGREGGLEGLLEYCEAQTVARN